MKSFPLTHQIQVIWMKNQVTVVWKLQKSGDISKKNRGINAIEFVEEFTLVIENSIIGYKLQMPCKFGSCLLWIQGSKTLDILG